METKFVKVSLGNASNFVALYTGLSPRELSALLSSVFKIGGDTKPAGFLEEGLTERGDGSEFGAPCKMLVPLTVACRRPELLRAPMYRLLLTRGSDDWLTDDQVATPQSLYQEYPDEANVYEEEEEEDEEEEEEEEEAENTTNMDIEDDEESEDLETAEAMLDSVTTDNLLPFVGWLQRQEKLTNQEAHVLKQMIERGDRVVFTAYQVAVSDDTGRDLWFLSALLKDIGANAIKEEGREVVVCQEELLEVIDVLHENGQISDEARAYLDNMVLIRSDVLAAAWQVYRMDDNIDELIDTIKAVVLNYSIASAKQDSTTSADHQEETTSEPERDSPVPHRPKRPLTPNPEQDFLHQVCEGMATQGLIAPEEWLMLQEMLSEENPYLMAAVDLYEKDRDMDELMGTLARFVKVERFRRGLPEAKATTRQKAEAALRQAQEDERTKELLRQAGVDWTTDGDTTERGSEVETGTERDSEVETGTERDSEASSAQNPPAPGLGTSADRPAEVPESYVKILETASKAGLVSVPEMRALTSAYSGNWEEEGFGSICRAAWEVFMLEKDGWDLLDTLMRVARLMSPYISVYADTEDELPVDTAVPPNYVSSSVAARKKAALRADEKKQKDILRGVAAQCLEVMIPQGLVTEEEGSALCNLGRRGRTKCLKALEAYRDDENLDNLLHSLALLAKDELQRQSQSTSETTEDTESQGWRTRSETSFSTTSVTASLSGAQHVGVAQTERVQKELGELVDCLGEDQKLTPQECQVLRAAIHNEDPKVFAAHDAYVAFQDVDDLIDTLMRIARRELQSRRSYPPADEDGIELTSMKRKEKDSGSESKLGLLTEQDRCDIICMMLDAGVFTKSQALHLTQLIITEDNEINQLFDDYESSKDVVKLVENVKKLSWNLPPGDNDEDEDAEDEEDDDAEIEQDSDSDILSNHFIELIAAMGLGRVEAAALRLAVVRDDPNLRAALEVYRIEGDPNDLRDTLQRIAREILEAVQQEEAQKDKDNEETEEAPQQVEKPVQDQVPRTQRTTGGAQVQESFDAQRKKIFDLLTSELVKAGMIGPQQEIKLQELYKKRDSVVMAAFDVYEIESNLEEFVDTLKRVAARDEQ